MITSTIMLIQILVSCSSTAPENTELDNVLSILPNISPFMYKSDSTSIANWLDRKLPDGRSLLEPINLILVDKSSSNSDIAIAKLNDLMETAGYGARYGHTGGYFGKMNGSLFSQQPSIKDHAFSDYMWAFTNNHSRIFGPFQNGAYYVWIASVSQEIGIVHNFSSFSKARDLLVKHLIQRANAVKLGSIELKNKIENDTESTEDHDGLAVIVIY